MRVYKWNINGFDEIPDKPSHFGDTELFFIAL